MARRALRFASLTALVALTTLLSGCMVSYESGHDERERHADDCWMFCNGDVEYDGAFVFWPLLMVILLVTVVVVVIVAAAQPPTPPRAPPTPPQQVVIHHYDRKE